MALTSLRRENQPDPGSGLWARLAIRAGTHRGPTAGLAPGYVQGNLAILPQALAAHLADPKTHLTEEEAGEIQALIEQARKRGE
jgi:uncharacterized protein YcsI (UPF0317 family)